MLLRDFYGSSLNQVLIGLPFVCPDAIVGQDTAVKSFLAVLSVPNGEEVLKMGHRDSISLRVLINIRIVKGESRKGGVVLG